MFFFLFACTPVEVATEGSLRALTYNVHGLPPEITGDDTSGRMEAIAPLLEGYDLIGLQEDFDDDNHAVLATTSHPVKVRFSELYDDDRFYGSGLAVFSTELALGHHNEHYTQCNGFTDGASDCLASKGFQVVRIALGAGEVHVYNTHMEAGNGDEDDAARASHVDQLFASMDQTSETILFLGDTNLGDDDPEDAVEIARLKDYGLQDGCELIGCDEPGRIDRFMVLNQGSVTLSIESWSVEEQFEDLSDHDAIATTWSWSASE